MLIYRAFTVVPTLLLGVRDDGGVAVARPRPSPRKESATPPGESARRVKEQSHKDEMSAAIRGDFERLRDRGVAATLAPHDDDRPGTARDESTDVSAGPPAAQEILPEHSEAVVAFELGAKPPNPGRRS